MTIIAIGVMNTLVSITPMIGINPSRNPNTSKVMAATYIRQS